MLTKLKNFKNIYIIKIFLLDCQFQIKKKRTIWYYSIHILSILWSDILKKKSSVTTSRMASESHKGLIFKFEERGIANNGRDKHYNGQVGAPCSQIQEMRLHPTWSQTTILTGINRDCWFRALVITRCRNTISIEFERGAYTNSLNSFSPPFFQRWILKVEK